MKNIILNQKAERDELAAHPYQQRFTKHNPEEQLDSPLIKLDALVEAAKELHCKNLIVITGNQEGEIVHNGAAIRITTARNFHNH